MSPIRSNAGSHSDVDARQRHQAADYGIVWGMQGDIRLYHLQRLKVQDEAPSDFSRPRTSRTTTT
ncbi:hypothetical protein O3W52_24360 [Ensifer psoraleae]|uniref:Uncharacterized protein n=1 Tax=Sinorhizobium psoraleae TaxID=520838 RepID=A0ABT4KP25_9HYPH|nr:hypothetical protein [Sinorhizobium psoraleae]MCZ4093076.1 hypothetical protein [Sinorhizobium psoraleae]